jgi:hypothetical protein
MHCGVMVTGYNQGDWERLLAEDYSRPPGPDEIIERIRTLQHAISLEMVVIHFFYGGMPRAKAEKSLRLFAENVLPAVQAMSTPVNPASLGQPTR